MRFKIIKQDKKSRARVGEISVAHGKIDTPGFVAVGTQASVKALSPRELKEIGLQVFFANTYHLYLRPGVDVIEKLGGVHNFMSWNGPVMTDSGGFQIFSLGLGQHILRKKGDRVKITLNNTNKGVTGKKLAEISEEGVEFKSHIDGSKHILTPEKSMEIQSILGADILMAFDDCTPYPCDYEYAKSSMDRTHRWAVRSLDAHKKEQKEKSKRKNRQKQNLYGVVQGSVYKELRKKSAQFIESLNTPGVAIGGVSVGESKKEMYKVLDWVVPNLSEEKPRHLLGVGEIDDIFEAIEKGVDTLDCVIPTRWGRNGTVLVHPQTAKNENSVNRYRFIITNAKYIKDSLPVDPLCRCFVCQNFSRAYMNHLYRANEILGIRLGTYHNLYFMVNLMKQIRKSIKNDQFQNLKKEWM